MVRIKSGKLFFCPRTNLSLYIYAFNKLKPSQWKNKRPSFSSNARLSSTFPAWCVFLDPRNIDYRPCQRSQAFQSFSPPPEAGRRSWWKPLQPRKSTSLGDWEEISAACRLQGDPSNLATYSPVIKLPLSLQLLQVLILTFQEARETCCRARGSWGRTPGGRSTRAADWTQGGQQVSQTGSPGGRWGLSYLPSTSTFTLGIWRRLCLLVWCQ